jgi:hypothetical protein
MSTDSVPETVPTDTLQLPELSPAQLKAIELLSNGVLRKEVCAMVKVDVKTLWNWTNKCEPFMTALKQRQELRRKAEKAFEEVLDGKSQRDANARLQAACIVLGHERYPKKKDQEKSPPGDAVPVDGLDHVEYLGTVALLNWIQRHFPKETDSFVCKRVKAVTAGNPDATESSRVREKAIAESGSPYQHYEPEFDHLPSIDGGGSIFDD